MTILPIAINTLETHHLLAAQSSASAVMYWTNTLFVCIIVLVFSFFMGSLFWVAYLSKTERAETLEAETDWQKALNILSLIVVEGIIIGTPFILAILIALSGHMIGDDFHSKTMSPERLTPYLLAFLALCVPQTLYIVPAIRNRIFAVLFPNIDTSRAVHKLAGFFYISIMMSLAFSIFISYDPKGITQSVTTVSQAITAAAQTLGYIVICLLGLGLFLKRSPQKLFERLGLGKINLTTLLQMAGITAIMIFASLVLEHLALQYTPPEIISVLKTFVSSMNKTPDWGSLLFNAVLVSLSAGIGEELIFRGLLQPRFGWIGSNLLFCLMHVYYGPTALLLVLFIIGLGFGWVRRKWNTTASITVHVLYDFTMLVGPVLLFSLTGFKM